MKYKLAKPLSIHELGQRKNQEDSIFPKLGAATENDRLFILCDGMGGHEAGEVASQAVCQTMSDHILSQADAEGISENRFYVFHFLHSPAASLQTRTASLHPPGQSLHPPCWNGDFVLL